MAFVRHHFRALGGINELQIHAVDIALAQQASDAAEAEVRRIEAKYSRYRSDSVLSLINAKAGQGESAIDAETAALLAYAQQCFDISEGMFDITSGVLRKAWNFSAQNEQWQPPSQKQIDALLSRIGWQHVQLTGQTITLPQGMEIDLGGIGKEYAADRVASCLHALGIAHALVNLGGDVRALGGQPVGHTLWQKQMRADSSSAWRAPHTKPWTVGVVHPREPGRTIATALLSDSALATSGDYERYIDWQGKRYCHILNPRTGWPVEHWHSVSVIAPLCVAAGSSCTIAMLKQSQALEFLQFQEVDYLLVDSGQRSPGEYELRVTAQGAFQR